MPEFQMSIGNDTGKKKVWNSLDDFTKGYITCMFWTDDTDGDLYADRAAEFCDLSAEAFHQIIQDAIGFQLDGDNRVLLELAYDRDGYSREQAGCDFWLTRNGHGCGFWDRDELDRKLGVDLTKAAKKYKTTRLYSGDDDRLYLE